VFASTLRQMLRHAYTKGKHPTRQQHLTRVKEAGNGRAAYYRRCCATSEHRLPRVSSLQRPMSVRPRLTANRATCEKSPFARPTTERRQRHHPPEAPMTIYVQPLPFAPYIAFSYSHTSPDSKVANFQGWVASNLLNPEIWIHSAWHTCSRLVQTRHHGPPRLQNLPVVLGPSLSVPYNLPQASTAYEDRLQGRLTRLMGDVCFWGGVCP
jgi:hypothetical protein